ncbi:MAG: hypothetical protein HYY23_02850 [Verrucomicrobia bacterium]|nr:hypothetical protein [Verrucomicrobiota bacterium]
MSISWSVRSSLGGRPSGRFNFRLQSGAASSLQAALRIVLLLALFHLCGVTGAAADAKIIKVLPHYLDLEGRHARSPSLYERDAYQESLRKSPEQRSALRFDIQWKAKGTLAGNLRLRMELRTSKNFLLKPLVLEQAVQKRRWFSSWSALQVSGEEFKQMGELLAWRATLWDGEKMLAEQRSFLW